MRTVPDPIDPPEGLSYGESTWEIALSYPAQGCWTEQEYLELDTNRRVEFSHGFVEFQPMLTTPHQRLILLLVNLVNAFATPRGLGEALIAGVRVRLWEGKYREPDVVFMLAEYASRITVDYWIGADLVMEVVSGGESDRHRDLVTKRGEYAKAVIPEYWIIDPELAQITVLVLDGPAYAVHGVYRRGQQATSTLLPGFAVDVTAVLEAAKR
ncbi:MAG TPA: Uma2 family endonuclease [Isosphaeraceae bacterium]|nr:Uma2 family endonuclease [Isosphaeraceae bacterium]